MAAGGPVPEHSPALVERLRFLCEEFSQAEISRRTGFSENNVSRYVRGTRMPMEFGSALVSELGVNPAWLMAGTGSPLATDVPDRIAGDAGGLLELVQAMNALSRMPLGALAGKGRARALRELDDSLRRFDTLRARMLETARPLARQLIAEYRGHVESRSLSRAEGTRRAIEQVLRLFGDDDLNVEFQGVLAGHLRVQSQFEQAVDLQRAVFLHGLARRSEIAPENCLEAQTLAGALWNLGRVTEARAVCVATLAFADPRGADWPECAALETTCAMAEIDLGLLTDAILRLEHAIPRMSPAHREVLGEGSLLRARLLSGTADPAAALAACRSRGQATALLRHAAWLQDAGLLRAAIKQLIGKGKQISKDEPDVRHHLELDRALHGDKAALGRMETFSEQLASERALGPRVRFSTLASLTQIALAAGDLRGAATHATAAQEHLDAMGALLPRIEALALHLRNLIRLAETKPGRKLVEPAAGARAWFAELAEGGYGCFRGI
jgi:transcriptional regulator with XRE-family HTH domain